MSDKEVTVYKRGEIARRETSGDLSEIIKQAAPIDLVQLVLLDDMKLALEEIVEHERKEEFEGQLDVRTLPASEQQEAINLIREWPYVPWATASFHNYGPDAVQIGINGSDPCIPLQDGEGTSIDFTKADKRIETIYYKCDPGETASVTVVGKY